MDQKILIVVVILLLLISSSGTYYMTMMDAEDDSESDFSDSEDTEETTYYITELVGTCSRSDELITDTAECKQAIDTLIPNNMTFMRTRDNQDGWEGTKATHPNGCSYMNKYETSQHVLTTGSNSVGTGHEDLHAVCKKPPK